MLLIMNMLTVFYIDTILSYGIVGTILLVLSSVAPVRLMMDMSQESGKRPIIGLYLSFLTVVAVQRNL